MSYIIREMGLGRLCIGIRRTADGQDQTLGLSLPRAGIVSRQANRFCFGNTGGRCPQPVAVQEHRRRRDADGASTLSQQDGVEEHGQ